jgi:hypothetical protein
MQKLIKGNIIWYSEKNQNGIIKDFKNNEYYFDISVWKCPVSSPFRDRLVSFFVNSDIKDCLCAMDVRDFLSNH